jgi:phospholipase C
MLSRMRSVAVPALLLFSTLLGACSSDGDSGTGPTSGGGGTPLPGPDAWNREVTPPSDAEADAKRTACAYERGALPAETQGKSRPNGDQIPIDHIVLVMMENRSFDHYFQMLPKRGQPDVDVAPEGFSNPDPEGNPVHPFRDTSYCFVDTNHTWTGSHEQVGDGKMDGFVRTNEDWHELPVNGTLDMLSGRRAMGYYDEADLPFYYWLANEFAIADRYHASLLGPTLPNRMFFYAATSFGRTTNTLPPSADTLPDYLLRREVTWKVYKTTAAAYGMFVEKVFDNPQNFVPIDQYFADAAAGTLPQVAFVDPGLAAEAFDQNDEHPPAIAQVGQKFTAEVIDALTKSPLWKRSALFLTYDEHGGLFDHVVPPPACKPDDRPVRLEPGDTVAEMDQYGVRVPMMVVSPYAKKHFVGHRTYDHTSIVRFVEARFVMPALTNRDANAEAPWEMFDFDDPPHMDPPKITIPTIDQAKLDACRAIFAE